MLHTRNQFFCSKNQHRKLHCADLAATVFGPAKKKFHMRNQNHKRANIHYNMITINSGTAPRGASSGPVIKRRLVKILIYCQIWKCFLLLLLTESGAAGQPSLNLPAGFQPRQVRIFTHTWKRREYFRNRSGEMCCCCCCNHWKLSAVY